MAEKNKRKNNIVKLAECSVMLALSVVLSFIEVWKMPMGGGITLLSMLPICLIAVKYGIKGALPTAFLYSVIQFSIGFFSGNVFSGRLCLTLPIKFSIITHVNLGTLCEGANVEKGYKGL